MRADRFIPHMETRLKKKMSERTPLWKIMTDHRDLREKILSLLSENDVKFFSLVTADSRAILRAAKVRIPERFHFEYFETASTIEFALDHGVKNDEACFDKAAEVGNIELLKYLHLETKAPLSARALCLATKSGHLPALKWLLLRGCPMMVSTFFCAVVSDSFEVMKFICENYCQQNQNGQLLIIMIKFTPFALNEGLQMLQYLHDVRGLDLKQSELPQHAAANGRIDILSYLKDNSICDWDAADCLEYATSARLEATGTSWRTRAEERRGRKMKNKDENLVHRLSQTIAWLKPQLDVDYYNSFL